MRVLVTGANGHVGFVLTQHLLEHGYQVRASVRDARDPGRTGRLAALGVEIVEADLLRPDAIARAVDGMEAVFQVAATYELVPKHGAESIIRDSVEGGLNVLRAAKATGVRRVVFTSSCVAIGTTPLGAPARDEKSWNDQLGIPYYRAKTVAEQQAWAFAKESGLDLVTVLPGGVGGPGFVRNTPTIDLIENVQRGMFRFGVAPGNFIYVDGRDVAEAHRLALETPSASGRYIVANDVSPSFRDLVETMRSVDPRTPKAGPLLPQWVLGFMPFIDALNHTLMGTARLVTPELVATVKGRVWNLDNGRAKAELGWSPRYALAASLRDTAAAIADARRAAA
ncbi:MAG: NAD-dependent epimerase/dehydratase family protein [Alphaproteobacteria bacterium]|nr:NAD-dependent epimerase/dehydratase family protein [Alphaproteobacteria bacterium]